MNSSTAYDQDLSNLYHLAKQIGRRAPFWVQGAGGNVSVKVAASADHPPLLFIKASGCRLDQMKPGYGVAAVDLARFNAEFTALAAASTAESDQSEQQYAQLLQDARAQKISQSKPSMETGFHALLPQKYVLHFHSLAAIEMAAPHNRALAEKIFAQLQISYKFIELCQPGLELTKKIIVDPNCTVYLLASHGVVIQGNEPGIFDLWEKLEQLQMVSANSSLVVFANDDFASAVNKLFAEKTEIEFNWQCLFPDAAVFSEKIRKLLPKPKLVKSDFAADKEADASQATEKRNHLEIVLATLILQQLEVPLPNLSPEYCATITGLPTEKFRQEFGQGAL